MKKEKIFISYRRKNGGVAYAYIINELLEQMGFDTFYDKVSMKESRGEFPDIINENLDDSEYLLILLQNDMFSRRKRNDEDWIEKEIKRFLLHGKKENILALPLEGFEWKNECKKHIPNDISFISNIQCLDSFKVGESNAKFKQALLEKLSYIKNPPPFVALSNLFSLSKPTSNIISVGDFHKIPIEMRWRDAKRVSVYAISCGWLITNGSHYIGLTYGGGKTSYRFMGVTAIEPGHQCNYIQIDETDEIKRQINNNIQNIKEILKRNNNVSDSSLEYRLTPSSITSTIQIVEYENQEFDYILVEFLPNRGSEQKQDDMPAAVIKRGDEFFDVYQKQFEKIWNEAKNALKEEKNE